MGMIRAIRLLNDVNSGATTGATLESILSGDAGHLGEWQQMLQFRGAARQLAASSTAMTAVIASSTAMTAVAASSTAMTAVAASSTAMTAVNANDQAVRIWMLAGTGLSYTSYANVAAVAASSTAMTAVAASSTARSAVYNSDTALGAIQASSTAISALKAYAGYTVISKSISSSATSLSLTGNAILVAYSQSSVNGAYSYAFANYRAGSTENTSTVSVNVHNTSTTVPAFTRVMALQSTATMTDPWNGSAFIFGVIYV